MKSLQQHRKFLAFCMSVSLLSLAGNAMFTITHAQELVPEITETTEVDMTIEANAAAGVVAYTNEAYANAIDLIEDQHAIESIEAEVLTEIEESVYSPDYSNMSETEASINSQIFEIKQTDMSTIDKIASIGAILTNEGNISYTYGSRFIDEEGTFAVNEISEAGVYYVDGMELDCSAFVQYITYIATCEDSNEGRVDGDILGSSTYSQTTQGKETSKLVPGTLCFKFNGGSGVARTESGDEEVEEYNHVAIYLGDNLYLDCNSTTDGVRISNTNIYTYYRNVL